METPGKSYLGCGGSILICWTLLVLAVSQLKKADPGPEPQYIRCFPCSLKQELWTGPKLHSYIQGIHGQVTDPCWGTVQMSSDYDDAVHSGVTCLYILLTSIVLVVQRTCTCMWLGDQMHNVGCKGCFWCPELELWIGHISCSYTVRYM